MPEPTIPDDGVTVDPIAAQMRVVRLRRHLSLPQAALRVGLEPIVVGSYERGDRQPGLRRLRQWVEGMGLRLLLVGGPSDTAVDGEQVWEEHGAVALYHGYCERGLDAIADLWARQRRDEVGPLVELHRVPVDHRLDGPWPAAGQRRNVRMVREFAAVVDAAGARGSAEVHGFWRGNSAGTRGCLDAARRAGFAPAVHRYEEVRAGG